MCAAHLPDGLLEGWQWLEDNGRGQPCLQCTNLSVLEASRSFYNGGWVTATALSLLSHLRLSLPQSPFHNCLSVIPSHTYLWSDL